MSIDRRNWLQQAACGFGGLAMAALAQRQAFAEQDSPTTAIHPQSPGLHHPARAKRVIFLFMQGGPSQVDSFDYKPLLDQRDGETIDFSDDRVRAKTGEQRSTHRVMKSPWKFHRYGQSERWASDLFPQTAQHMDSLCMVHSMHTDGVAHGPATLFLHCGAMNFIRPSMGSWVTYGLGSENENLPGFVSICPSAGNGGARNYGSAFLPAQFQGTAVGRPGKSDLNIQNLVHPQLKTDSQRRQLDLVLQLNRAQQEKHLALAAATDSASSLHSSPYDAVIDSYELAWRMQSEAPDLFDLSDEPQATLDMYGIGKAETDAYGRECLLARRLCEAGVRYIQVNYGDNSANPAWDQHSDLPKHEQHARRVDQPIAALLTDLKQRGLLEDTIVWWGAEFGRTPYAQENGTGRDHNPSGFTMWLAGGGFQPGLSYGRTDEFGHEAIENKVHMHDLHATILHLLGIDHLKLTYRYAGRDFRLTDVHGHVVDALFA